MNGETGSRLKIISRRKFILLSGLTVASWGSLSLADLAFGRFPLTTGGLSPRELVERSKQGGGSSFYFTGQDEDRVFILLARILVWKCRSFPVGCGGDQK